MRKGKDAPLWKRKLHQRIPILSWMQDYTVDSAISDLIAGITVGLTVMPQSLAYATLAGLEPQVTSSFYLDFALQTINVRRYLIYGVHFFFFTPPQYGLYSAFAGCLVYCIFGSCKDITIGPTALMSLMTYQQVVGRNPDFAVLLCFLTGIIQWIMGFFHLGNAYLYTITVKRFK